MMTAGASPELGYDIGIFQVICLCRRRKKYQLEAKTHNNELVTVGKDIEVKDAEEEKVVEPKATDLKVTGNEQIKDNNEKVKESNGDVKAGDISVFEKFKENVNNELKIRDEKEKIVGNELKSQENGVHVKNKNIEIKAKGAELKDERMKVIDDKYKEKVANNKVGKIDCENTKVKNIEDEVSCCRCCCFCWY